MDAREGHYTRVEVTKDISEPHHFQHIYTYVGKNENILNHDEPPDAIVPKSYVELVEKGFRAISEEALEMYRQTTQAPIFPVVATCHT